MIKWRDGRDSNPFSPTARRTLYAIFDPRGGSLVALRDILKRTSPIITFSVSFFRMRLIWAPAGFQKRDLRKNRATILRRFPAPSRAIISRTRGAAVGDPRIGPRCFHNSPASLKEYTPRPNGSALASPTMTWSRSGISRSFAPSRSMRVTRRSAALGAGSPLG